MARRFVQKHGLAAVIAVAAAVAMVYASYRIRGAWTGDATIYLPYARNAAEGHLFQYNVGEFSSGSTSPLWSLLLALPFLFDLGIDGARVFSAALAVLALCVTIACARYVSRSWLAAAVAALFVVGTMTIFAVSLYESSLVVILSGLSIAAGERVVRVWSHDERPSLSTAAPLFVVWAALPLARPEAVLLVALQALALLLFSPVDRRRAAATILSGLALAAVPAAAYFGYSLAELGTPSTSSQGRGFALHESAGRLFGPFYRSADALRELTRSPWIFAVVPGLAGLAVLLRNRSTRWLGAYGVAAVAAYVSLLTFVAPAFYDTPRYLLPVVPIVVVGTACLLARTRGSRLWWPAVGAATLVLGGSAVHRLEERVDFMRSLEISNHEVFERDVTALVNRLARPGDVLLSYEVQLRYYLRDDVRILSQDGIIDGKVHPYQERRDMTAFLLRYRPRWWIADGNVNTRPYLKGSVLERSLLAFRQHPHAGARTLDGVRFTLVARRKRPPAVGFGSWEMLFRLDYPSSDAARLLRRASS
jgi:hypothetical protein